MAISLVAVGQIITATIQNAIITAVNAIGTNVITPTSVAGTGTSLSGTTVVCTAATSASVNGVFSATYNSYRIIISLPTVSTSLGITCVLRLAGTDATTAVYDTQLHQGFQVTSSASQVIAGTSWLISSSTSSKHRITIELFDPAVATATGGFAISQATTDPMVAASTSSVSLKGLQHRTATAYDGFTVTPSTGNFTGTIRVQGIL